MEKIILTGDRRPVATGHYVGSLKRRVELQIPACTTRYSL